MPTNLVNSGNASTSLGLKFASIHLSAVIFSAFLSQQGQGWAGVYVWPVWFLIDLPWSILYWPMALPSIDSWIEELRSQYTVLSWLLYSPYLIHGIIGTVWWAFVPNIYFRFQHWRAST